MNGTVGLRGLANRALRILLEPFDDALLVIHMLALELDNPLVLLELTVTDRAKVLLPTRTARLIFYLRQFLQLLLCQSLLRFPSQRHHLQQPEEVAKGTASSAAEHVLSAELSKGWPLSIAMYLSSDGSASAVRLLNYQIAINVLNPPEHWLTAAGELVASIEVVKVAIRMITVTVFFVLVRLWPIVFLQMMTPFLLVNVIAVVRRYSGTAGLLMLVHQAFGEGLPAVGARFSTEGALVWVGIQLNQALHVTAIGAGEPFLLLPLILIVENFLSFGFRLSTVAGVRPALFYLLSSAVVALLGFLLLAGLFFSGPARHHEAAGLVNEIIRSDYFLAAVLAEDLRSVLPAILHVSQLLLKSKYKGCYVYLINSLEFSRSLIKLSKLLKCSLANHL